jgi:hypothetical protein
LHAAADVTLACGVIGKQDVPFPEATFRSISSLDFDRSTQMNNKLALRRAMIVIDVIVAISVGRPKER